jgi:dipeptide/tripeptide permease
MNAADIITTTLLIGASLALVAIIWNYAKGLRACPRDLWLLFGYKFVEYSAYAAMNMAVSLWLSKDCKLGDIAAGSFISAWSICLSVMGMFAGALVDAIGIRKTMVISVVFLIFSRLVFAFVTHPLLVFVFGFMPLAVGFAILQ